MKVKVLETAVFIVLAAWNLSSFAQVPAMYVAKNGTPIPLSGIENVTFEDVTSEDTLFVHKSNGSSVEKIALDDIQLLSFSSTNLTVGTLSGNEVVYALNDIAKILFKDASTTGIHNPSAQGNLDVFVYVSPTGDVVVESSVTIKSLTLFGVDGKMIYQQHCNGGEKQCAISLQENAAGVYLIQVETEQGAVVKKVINQLKK